MKTTQAVGSIALLMILGCQKPQASPPARSTMDSLHVEMRDGQPVLQLPPAMKSALDAYAPDYQPWKLSEYDERVVVKQKDIGPLFAVVADFNGDGKQDVALDGHTATKELLFVLLSDRNAYRAVELSQRPIDPTATPRQQYLERFTDTPDKRPAVGVGFEGQGGMAYYWKGGKFVELVPDDE